MHSSPGPDSRDILRAVIDATPDAVFVKDVDGRYVLVNDAFARFIGLRPDQIIGKRDIDIYPFETARTFVAQDREVLATGAAQTFEGEAIGSGQVHTYLVTKGVCRDEDGTIVGLFGISHDITARKQAEEALRKAEIEEQVRRSQTMEAVGRLAGGVAHDFNNLLTAIRGRCELLLASSALDEAARTNIEDIERSAAGAARLTRQLLAFGRQQVIEPSVLDLNQTITGVAGMLRRMLGDDITVTLVLEPGLHRIKADPGQIEQILVNLALNAREAMPDGGSLIIETHNASADEAPAEQPEGPAGSYVAIVVTDTGRGMPPEVQQQLFEPFFSTKGIGTGLGLASVHGMISQNRGTIRVESEIGKGTTFHILWPATEEALVAQVSTAAPRSGSETVLVVEDNLAVAEIVCLHLQQRGYRVLCVSDPLSAERACAENQPNDLLLTDIVMPGLTGPALAKRVAPLYPNMAVLFMSGYTDDPAVRASVAESGIAFLQKPFTGDQLAEKVRRALDSRRS